MKIDPKEYVEIKKEFNNNTPISKIARSYGVSRPVIYNILKKEYGITPKGGPKHKDKIGKKFGHLIIKDLVKRNKNNKWIWRAICYCENCNNNNFETSIQNILRGSTTSCGCRRDQYEKITGKNSIQFTGYEDIRGKTWSTFQRRSNQRGHSFDLDIKYAWELYLKQNKKCYFSDLPIYFGKHNGETTASLDRIDNEKGYIVGNVKWVHKDVNIMKSIFPEDYFLGICNLISKRHKVKFDMKLKKDCLYGKKNKKTKKRK